MAVSLLRNIGIVAHIDAGKTTLTERFLFLTGVERRIGEVHDGAATMDWMTEERERGITISAAATTCPWRGHQIQIIDTPGHVDFTIEVSRSLRVLDGVVVVLDAVAGVQAQTENVLRQADLFEIPRIALINKMDRPGANFQKSIHSLEERGTIPVVPVQIPMGEGEDFVGVIDLIKLQSISWGGENGEVVVTQSIPESLLRAAEKGRDLLCSRVAEEVSSLADLYLEEGTLNPKQLSEGLRVAILQRKLVPVFAGAALCNKGVQPVLDALVDWMPSPEDRPSVKGKNPATGARLERTPKASEPFCALCFKIYHESFGDLTYLRIYSGTLREGESVGVPRLQKTERVERLFRMHADSREAIPSASAGEIVAVMGFKHAQTGDTLCSLEEEMLLESLDFPDPVIRMSLEPREPADQDSLTAALRVVAREDPSLVLQLDEDTGQTVISGMGELHLEILLHRLERDFSVRPLAGRPQVSRREFVKTPQRGVGRAEKRTPDGGQAVSLTLQVSPSEAQLIQWQPHGMEPIPAALRVSLQEGVGAMGLTGPWGYPLSGLTLSVAACEWTPGDRPPSLGLLFGAFTSALSDAIKGNTGFLEPVMNLSIHVPKEFLSGVLADLSSRQAEVLSVNALTEEVFARAPMDCLFSYSTDLRSLSQGRASFLAALDGFSPLLGSREAKLLKRLGGSPLSP